MTGVHDKGLEFFTVHKQLAKAKKKQPTARKQYPGLPQFMKVEVSLTTQTMRCLPWGQVKTPRPLVS